MFKPATREVVAIVGTSLCACGLGIMGGWIANTRKRKTATTTITAASDNLKSEARNKM